MTAETIVPASTSTRRNGRRNTAPPAPEPVVLLDDPNLTVIAVGTKITVQFDVSDEALRDFGHKGAKSNVFAATGYGVELPGYAALTLTAYRTFTNQKLHDTGEAPAPKAPRQRVYEAPVSFK